MRPEAPLLRGHLIQVCRVEVAGDAGEQDDVLSVTVLLHSAVCPTNISSYVIPAPLSGPLGVGTPP
jgi:hypothetical protein